MKRIIPTCVASAAIFAASLNSLTAQDQAPGAQAAPAVDAQGGMQGLR